jgi:uncharacterized SAM-binding protein YcdF (DUF218 family)
MRLLAGSVVAFAATMATVVVDGLIDEAPDGPCDLAVVLGAKVNPDGHPSQQLHDRLARAQRVYEEGRARLVMVSGGRGVEGHEEADVMAAWLVARGVPPERLVVDRDGWTTWHTARNARRALDARGLHTALVVTSYYHVPRARLALRRAGIARVWTARAAYRPALRDLYSVPREAIAWPWYALRGE